MGRKSGTAHAVKRNVSTKSQMRLTLPTLFRYLSQVVLRVRSRRAPLAKRPLRGCGKTQDGVLNVFLSNIL